KCRIRDPWWRVPLGTAPDFFVSYMSGSTPRIVENAARILNLNSVHGLRVLPGLCRLARLGLPVMAMSSASLLSAELVGRTYGGGILKLEPREASDWLVPSPDLMKRIATDHADLLKKGRRFLNAGDVEACTAVADEILVSSGGRAVSGDVLRILGETRLGMVKRRIMRASSKAS
ncbi:MAG: SAM-dependent methyltransferase, partial [Pseudolysinimonas sp.]